MGIFKKLFCLSFLIIILYPASARAATLYMEPAEGIYGPGDSAAVDIKVEVDNDCINAIEALVRFPSDTILVEDFLVGESILNLWVDRPAGDDFTAINSQGEMHFSGGIPGGYCGRIPGDPGVSNIVGRVIFRVPGFTVVDEKLDKVKIDFGEGTRVLRNDGLGTADILKTTGAIFTISESPINQEDIWQDKIKSDKRPPEPFTIELHSRPDIFSGGYYAIFSTVDKQSGLDRYEILEIRPDEELDITPESTWLDWVLGRERPAPAWLLAEMPYLLHDQSLQSIIKVKAIDKAGNERMVEYIPPAPLEEPVTEKISSERLIVLSLIGGGVLAFIVLLIIFIKKIFTSRASRQREEEENNNNEKK